MFELLRGFAIGLLFGLPVGAVGALTVQRTFGQGAKAGLLTGLGSSAADCCYAAAGAFGMTLVSDFLLRYQTMIHLLGGVFLGAYFWWGTLTAVTCFLKKRAFRFSPQQMNRVFGTILCLFGIVVFLQLLLNRRS